jgi:hypothetical protein
MPVEQKNEMDWELIDRLDAREAERRGEKGIDQASRCP